MADLAITASSVVPTPSGTGVVVAVVASGTAGETITAGQTVYIFVDANGNNKLKLGVAGTGATATTANAVGIALNGASLNQPIDYAVSGDVTIGPTTPAMIAGEVYVMGDTAGGIDTSDNQLAGEYGTVIGIATSTTILRVGIVASGVVHG